MKRPLGIKITALMFLLLGVSSFITLYLWVADMSGTLIIDAHSYVVGAVIASCFIAPVGIFLRKESCSAPPKFGQVF
ncbi:MAG: hypothetical protein ACREJQ_06160 [bacterium]